MSKTAFIFPGQGAQYIGMGKDFYEQIPVSKKVFDTASEVSGLDMRKLCFEENDKLSITEYTQIAMMVTSHAILVALHEKGFKASIHAGLSLGEYNALLASSILSLEDACCIIRKRGIYMQDAVPVGRGAMAAVLGMTQEKVKEELSKIEGVVEIANYNCPGQIVISGEVKAIETAKEQLKTAGAKRVLPLNVSGPFHSSLLKGAGEKLFNELEEVKLHSFEIPYVSNVTAKLVSDTSMIKELLKEQVYSSVRWQQSVETMIAWGVDTFVEIGPGKTLTGFMRKINKDVKAYHIETITDLEQISQILEEAKSC